MTVRAATENVPTAHRLAVVLQQLSQIVVGKNAPLRLALACLLARGHLLIEDIPGVGKSTLAQALATTLGLKYARIQFTSDLLPADVLGVSIFEEQAQAFRFHPGPIFHSVVLADEINRAPPKTQSALLEAMEERQVSIDGVTRVLPEPFFVIATQNPVEQIGAYPLPESQLDRFILAAEMGPPTDEEAMEVLARREHGDPIADLRAVVSLAEVIELQDACLKVVAAPAIRTYIVSLLHAIRSRDEVLLPASMRSGVYLQRAAQAWALFEGRDFVLPDDIKLLALPVLSHRLGMRGRFKAADVIQEVVASLPLPPLRQH
jgi:MoxR-like ATPase